MKSILVFRIGSLGDILVSVPSLWALKDNFPDARLTLLADHQINAQHVSAQTVLDGSQLVDEFITYPVGASTIKSTIGRLSLLKNLRSRRFDALAYLAPSYRTTAQAARDRLFFRAAGISTFYGMQGFAVSDQRETRKPLPRVPQEADQLLARLAHDGLRVPALGHGKMDIRLGQLETGEFEQWNQRLPSNGGRRWIGVGIGGKQSVKLWPLSRYQEVIAALIDRFDVWPVIFASEAERTAGNELLAAWGRGYNAAGSLTVRGAMAAMRACALYLGNDTGTTHMAAAVGVKCVAIFSSRAAPGLWYPYGEGHRVFRTQIDCEGCRLSECIARKRECLLSIESAEVITACAKVLADNRVNA